MTHCAPAIEINAADRARCLTVLALADSDERITELELRLTKVRDLEVLARLEQDFAGVHLERSRSLLGARYQVTFTGNTVEGLSLLREMSLLAS